MHGFFSLADVNTQPTVHKAVALTGDYMVPETSYQSHSYI